MLVGLVGCSESGSDAAIPAATGIDPSILATGIASWYGEEYQGKPTASGEAFNMNELTAAHKTLPFGTKVEVENLANGRRITVRINDRGPFTKDRILDVSKRAASELGMLSSGITDVALRLDGS